MDISYTFRDKILVVDDDAPVCRLITEALKVEGYDPITCYDPEDALIASKRELFGLAFVDINMPNMNGLDLADKIASLAFFLKR